MACPERISPRTLPHRPKRGRWPRPKAEVGGGADSSLSREAGEVAEAVRPRSEGELMFGRSAAAQGPAGVAPPSPLASLGVLPPLRGRREEKTACGRGRIRTRQCSTRRVRWRRGPRPNRTRGRRPSAKGRLVARWREIPRARGRIRTCTPRRAADFKSAMSTVPSPGR